MVEVIEHSLTARADMKEAFATENMHMNYKVFYSLSEYGIYVKKPVIVKHMWRADRTEYIDDKVGSILDYPGYKTDDGIFTIKVCDIAYKDALIRVASYYEDNTGKLAKVLV